MSERTASCNPVERIVGPTDRPSTTPDRDGRDRGGGRRHRSTRLGMAQGQSPPPPPLLHNITVSPRFPKPFDRPSAPAATPSYMICFYNTDNADRDGRVGGLNL